MKIDNYLENLKEYQLSFPVSLIIAVKAAPNPYCVANMWSIDLRHYK